MNAYFLKSERLGFRTWSYEDLPLAIQLWGDEEVTRLFDVQGKLDDDRVKKRLTKEIATMRTYKVQYWPIFLLFEDQFIGACGLRPYKTEEKIFELGVHIRHSQWRKGYASEACLAAMKYSFGSLSVKALFAGHHPQNKASRHLLTKIRFRYTQDEFYAPTGLMHPSYLITAEKFLKTRHL